MNRRDAVCLARLLRAGELKEIRVPDEVHEIVGSDCGSWSAYSFATRRVVEAGYSRDDLVTTSSQS